jgi:hypothetical protein
MIPPNVPVATIWNFSAYSGPVILLLRLRDVYNGIWGAAKWPNIFIWKNPSTIESPPKNYA